MKAKSVKILRKIFIFARKKGFIQWISTSLTFYLFFKWKEKYFSTNFLPHKNRESSLPTLARRLFPTCKFRIYDDDETSIKNNIRLSKYKANFLRFFFRKAYFINSHRRRKYTKHFSTFLLVHIHTSLF